MRWLVDLIFVIGLMLALLAQIAAVVMSATGRWEQGNLLLIASLGVMVLNAVELYLWERMR